MNTIKAFSLVELMVVIAIVALLSAIAAPTYKQYITRAKYTEGINIALDCLDRVQTYLDINNLLTIGTNTITNISMCGASQRATTATLSGSSVSGIRYDYNVLTNKNWIFVSFNFTSAEVLAVIKYNSTTGSYDKACGLTNLSAAELAVLPTSCNSSDPIAAVP